MLSTGSCVVSKAASGCYSMVLLLFPSCVSDSVCYVWEAVVPVRLLCGGQAFWVFQHVLLLFPSCFSDSVCYVWKAVVSVRLLCGGAGLLGVSACFTIVSVLCFRFSMLRMGGRRAGKAALWGAGLLTGAGLIKSHLDNQKVSATRANNCQSSGLKFPSKENYPDLTNHNNVMASHLTPEVGDTIM